MESDLKTKLFSNVLLSARTEPVSLKMPGRKGPSIAGIATSVALVAAGAGLVLLLFAKVKPYF